MLYPEAVLGVSCPYCFARPGKKCKTVRSPEWSKDPSVKLSSRPHMDRERVARGMRPVDVGRRNQSLKGKKDAKKAQVVKPIKVEGPKTTEKKGRPTPKRNGGFKPVERTNELQVDTETTGMPPHVSVVVPRRFGKSNRKPTDDKGWKGNFGKASDEG